MKYIVDYTSKKKKQYKNAKYQGKDLNKLYSIIEKLANGESLENQYKNHNLITDKIYKNCYECHIEPDWLLIYQIKDNELILLLIATGTHSELFNN